VSTFPTPSPALARVSGAEAQLRPLTCDGTVYPVLAPLRRQARVEAKCVGSITTHRASIGTQQIAFTTGCPSVETPSCPDVGSTSQLETHATRRPLLVDGQVGNPSLARGRLDERIASLLELAPRNLI